MLDISMPAPTQSLATELLNLYLKVFVSRNLEKRRMETIDSAENLKQSVRQTGLELKEAEASLLDFVVEYGFSATKESGLGQVFSLINRRIKTVEGHGTVRSNILEQPISNNLPSLPLTMAPKEQVDRLSADLEKLLSEQSGLSETLGSNHPRMIALTGKITFLRNRIEYATRESSPNMTQESAEMVSASYNNSEHSKVYLTKAKSLEEQYSDLKRELDYKSDFHKLVRKEAQEWSIKTKTISNNIAVIDGPRAGKGRWW